MSDTRSFTMNPRGNAELPLGRRIFNVPPTDSKLVAGRSARPGDPGYDQDFGAGGTRGAGGLVRTNTQTGGYEPRNKGRNAHFDNGASQYGRTVAGQGAQHISDQQFASAGGVRDTDMGGNQRLNRTNTHQVSGQSLIGSSGEIPYGGGGINSTLKPQRTQSKLDESTAAMGRPPQHEAGLTEFLRREYYRRMGIYLNGSMKEEGLLLNFWKDHVSEAYKTLKEEKKKQQKMDTSQRKEKELEQLRKTDPNAFRRVIHERESKEKAQLEQMEREQNIASRHVANCSVHLKQPSEKCTACKASMMRSTMRPQSGKPGTAQLPRRNSSAVPAVPNKTYSDYSVFANVFEMDVVYTISKDLEHLTQQEKQAEMSYMQSRQKAMEKADQKYQGEAFDNMLQVYWLLPNRPAENAKQAEEQKNSPSKQAALPPQPPSASKNEKQQSMKEMMKNPKQSRMPQLKQDMEIYPEDVRNKYKFFVQLFTLIVRNIKYVSNDPAIVKEQYLNHRAAFAWPSDERTALTIIAEFFEPSEFFKRLNLHREHFCKSKTKKQQLLKLYYVETLQRDRQPCLIDFIPADKINGPQDGMAVIQKDIDDKVAAQQLQEQKKQEAILAKQQKAKLNQQRMNELAKPADRWKVGKKLTELQKQFPHDRVLQRMVKEEFRTNQTFRYPVEYDQFQQDEEVKMKHMINDDTGLKKRNYEDGDNKLEAFKANDVLLHDRERQKTVITKRTKLAFEADLIKEAQLYTVEASKRLNMAQGERKTYRKSLAEIYAKMREKHPDVVQDQYKLETYGMKVDSETYKKAYPDKFKRYFFHLIKSLNGKAPGKMTNKQVYKQSKRLPTTFMVAGTSKRCTIHQVSCPVEPCPYRTHNKKIVMTASLAKSNIANTKETRSRVFYRDDYVKEMPAIFMTNDDQLNCRFEPKVGSLDPDFWKLHPLPLPEKLKMTCETEAAFREKHGDNLKTSHPEVYKKGILKKATREFNAGEFNKSKNTLMIGFKLRSLRQNHEPNFVDKQMKRDAQKAADEKAEAEKLAKDGKDGNDDMDGLTGMKGLEQLKEDPDEVQKKMPNENAENIKLAPIILEAYQLLVKIENLKIDADKKIIKLEKEKRRLREKREHLASLQSVEDQAANAKDLYKTIMCPLILTCPNDTRARYPMSSAKTVTQLGSACPYAHHPMELRFPQTLTTKITAISKIQATVTAQVHNKKPQAAFIPTGRIFECSGGCFAVYKCNMCDYKQRAGTLITDLDHKKPFDPEADRKKKRCRSAMMRAEASETTNYITEMRTIKKELNLDESYCKKFGLLKKASILAYYGREKDAKYEVARAATIVAQQRKMDEEKQEAIQQRWKFKLGLDDGFEMPERANLKKKHPKDITDEDLAECELGPGTTLATIRLYINKVSPFNNNAYNKNVFLDRCIEDLYLECEGKKIKKHSDIERMKKHIEGLEEIAELAEQFGEEGVEENLLEDEGEGVKFKPRKTKMCPDIMAKRKCKNGKTCKLAHNPLQLELIAVSKKITNLKGVVTSQSRALNQNQTMAAWIPSNSFIEGDIDCFRPYIDCTEDQGADEDNEDKPKSIFEREDLFKDPIEEKD